MAEYCSSLRCYAFAPCGCQGGVEKEEAVIEEEDSKLPELAACIRDESAPVAKRIQCVYLLRQIGGPRAVKALAPALLSASVLLSHEVAYIMGQMQDLSALPFLTETLGNKKLDPITRHEAGEALAALSTEQALPILQLYLNDECVEVRDTCQISVDRIFWRQQNPTLAATEKSASNFHSVDPAPGHMPLLKDAPPEQLGDLLCNPEKSLFERYTAMFSLRNQNSEESVLELCRGFADKSAVFRHEVAYVLGQIQHVASVPALALRLQDLTEHAMVRHEAAEALGSINDERCAPLLEAFQEAEKDSIVKESCDVALSIAEYWEEFESQEAE
jgi:deoxyhypusine monooxygenase